MPSLAPTMSSLAPTMSHASNMQQACEILATEVDR
jgi:hypothetical protein